MRITGGRLGLIYTLTHCVLLLGCEAKVSLPQADIDCNHIVSPYGVFTGENVQVRTYDKYGKLVPVKKLQSISDGPFFKELSAYINVEFTDKPQTVDEEGLFVNVINHTLTTSPARKQDVSEFPVINYEYPWYSDAFDIKSAYYPQDLIGRYKERECQHFDCFPLSPNTKAAPQGETTAGFLIYQQEALRASYCFFSKPSPLPDDLVSRIGAEEAADYAAFIKRFYAWNYAQCVARSLGLNGKYDPSEMKKITIFNPSRFIKEQEFDYIQDDEIIANTMHCIALARKK